MKLLVETAQSGRPYVTAGTMLVCRYEGTYPEEFSKIKPGDSIIFRGYKMSIFAVEFALVKYKYIFLVVEQKILTLNAGLIIHEMYGQQIDIEVAD